MEIDGDETKVMMRVIIVNTWCVQSFDYFTTSTIDSSDAQMRPLLRKWSFSISCHHGIPSQLAPTPSWLRWTPSSTSTCCRHCSPILKSLIRLGSIENQSMHRPIRTTPITLNQYINNQLRIKSTCSVLNRKSENERRYQYVVNRNSNDTNRSIWRRAILCNSSQ